jgi:N-acyl-D-aspartate/D-glutamate deacylase
MDLKIANATVIDGTGAARFQADIGVHRGRIVTVGKLTEQAKRSIDGTGLVVAPGFVDLHTHYDAQVFWDPMLTPSSLHGVTTIFGGFCGFSIAPLTPDSAAYLLPMLARVEGMPASTLKAGVPWNWTSFGSYLDRLEGTLGINAGFSVGHSAVRRLVMGTRAVGEPATEIEISQMERLVARSLSEGAMGFSTTISQTHNDANGDPVPSRFASVGEHLRLAGVVADYPGTTLEMLPDLSFPHSSVELLTNFSLAGKRPVNWNVLAVHSADADERARVDRQLAATDYARARGAEVIALTLPGTSSSRLNLRSGFVFDALPGWGELFRLPPAERVSRLRDRAYRAQLAGSAASERGLFQSVADWPAYTIVEVHHPANKRFEGRLVADVAAELGKQPLDVMFDIAVEDNLLTSFMPRSGSDDSATWHARAQVWKDDRTVLGGSDAGAHVDMIDSFALATTLLQKGVREHQVITLEEAIRLLTSAPARLMGLNERGVIKVGNHADLVLFDPKTMGRGPVYTRFDLPGNEARLYADPIGIQHVIVNGEVIVADGKQTGARPGKVLRSGKDTSTVNIPAGKH